MAQSRSKQTSTSALEHFNPLTSPSRSPPTDSYEGMVRGRSGASDRRSGTGMNLQDRSRFDDAEDYHMSGRELPSMAENDGINEIRPATRQPTISRIDSSLNSNVRPGTGDSDGSHSRRLFSAPFMNQDAGGSRSSSPSSSFIHPLNPLARESGGLLSPSSSSAPLLASQEQRRPFSSQTSFPSGLSHGVLSNKSPSSAVSPSQSENLLEPSGVNGGQTTSASHQSLSFGAGVSPSFRRPSLSPSTAESTSLALNYLPHKFSRLHEPGQYAHRRKTFGYNKGSRAGSMVSSTNNVAEEIAMDYVNRLDQANTGHDGAQDKVLASSAALGMANNRPPGFSESDMRRAYEADPAGKEKGKLVWNKYKWALFAYNTLLLCYSIAILIVCLLVWFNVFDNADILRVGNTKELILSTTAGALCLLTALIGYNGIILNNRAFLAVYNLLLWACLAFIVAPGYLTYKQRTFNLEGKINAQWSRVLKENARLRIQNRLNCCGYYSPFVEATVSNLCYARSILPGCKSRYLKFERKVLQYWYIAGFALVPVQIGAIVTALMCSNHVTYRFGKRLTPKRYRLDTASMAVIMDEYASEIAQRYGESVAKEAIDVSALSMTASEKPSRTNSFADVK